MMKEACTEIEALRKRAVKFEENFKKCSRANRTKGYLNGRLTGLDELWQNVCEVNDRMEVLKDGANANISYFEDDQFGTLEAKYYQLKGEIKDQLEALEPQQRGNSNQNQNQNHNGQQNLNQSNVKLPKIGLPSFEGSYHTWMSFKNRFTKLIHEKTSLSNVEKLEYLKSCVKGEAEKAIQRFQITDQNYTAAWERLNAKYDNMRILQDTQIETIIDRCEIKQESAKEIRELIDVVQESLESLANLGVATDSWDPMLVVLVKRKLPFKTREEWEKQLEPESVPKYAELSAFLERRFRTVESLKLVGGATSETSAKVQKLYGSKFNSSQTSNTRAKCSACNNSFHSLMVCEVFKSMSMSNRWAFANAKKLCRNCLATGHLIKDCRSSGRCFKCKRSHHTLLHRDDSDQTSAQEPNYSKSNFLTRGQSGEVSEANYNSRYDPNGKSMFIPGDNKSSEARRHPSRETKFPSNNIKQNAESHQHQLNTDAPNFQPSQSNENQQSKRNLTTVAESQDSSLSRGKHQETLFPTAVIKFRSKGGIVYHLRALFDQCSEDVFIRAAVAKMLGGVQFKISSFDVTGLQGVVTSRVERATTIRMIVGQEEIDMEANIVQELVGMIPKTIVRWPKEIFKNIK